MLPLRPRPPLTQDEIAVLLATLPTLPSLSATPAPPAVVPIVLNFRDQRNGLRGMEKARRIFLAAFVAIVEAWAAGMISTGVGAAACVGSVCDFTSIISVGVIAPDVAVAVDASASASASFIVAVVLVVVALALLWVAAASAAGTAATSAAAALSFCCTFVPIFDLKNFVT